MEVIKFLAKENKILKKNYEQLRSDFESEKTVNNQILEHTCASIKEIKLSQNRMELSLENLFNPIQSNTPRNTQRIHCLLSKHTSK